MLKFIDANCMIGRRLSPREGAPLTTEDYIEIMDRCGIEKALVYHAVAKESIMEVGNQLLEQETTDRFLKQWVVMPGGLGEFIPEEKLLSAMKEKDVRSVRMLPGLFPYSVRPYASGKLIHMLTEAKVTIFVDKKKMSWEDVYTLVSSYPETRFVLCNYTYRELRQLFPLVEGYKNLMIDTANLFVHDGIREFCRRFGAERLIFGTAMPEGAPSNIVPLVTYADINMEEKQMIASGNILRLLEEVSL